jgi:hypothetical protein
MKTTKYVAIFGILVSILGLSYTHRLYLKQTNESSTHVAEEGFEQKAGPKGATKKVAFCFLVYDKLNHEDRWLEFFRNAPKDKYNLYFHYKENVPMDPLFERAKLPHCISTKWGDVSLVRAMNLLFKAAYFDDESNTKFVMLSNSCIPLKSFDHVYDFLTRDDKGHVNAFRLHEFTTNRMTKLNREYPHYFGKASQWIILNRTLVNRLAVTDTNVDKYCGDVFAPDEVYYYTFIKVYGLEDQIVVTDFQNAAATTFVYWNGMDYKYADREFEKKTKVYCSAVKNYAQISAEELQYLYDSPALFGRKFTKACAFPKANP